MSSYILYYDSGTTNTRAYLLDEEFRVCCVEKKNVGSRDSAICGSNRVLIEGLKELYDRVLEKAAFGGEDIKAIYASGMITSPYGLVEIPHSVVPLHVKDFADELFCFHEDSCLHRDVWLVPGLKTVNEDFSFVGNMRGEEIEIIGTLDELHSRGIHNAALIMPGSHTHVTYIKNDEVSDIISNFTGELFHAIQKETILSPVLDREVKELDKAMVQKGVENIGRFGFNRALYICHAMRIMNTGTPEERYSYAEGVVNGGIRLSLEYYCEHRWKDCDTVAVVSDEFMYKLFSMIFEGSPYIKHVVWLPISADKSYAVEGLRKIISVKGDKHE